jgi:xanthine dehydrogenase accessory factor
MFKTVVNCIEHGRSPFLFTAIEGERMGQTAVKDGETITGYAEIVRDVPDGTPLPCVRDGVLIERVTTQPHLILCGAGHVSVATAKIAKLVGFRVTVIDERADFCSRARFPEADALLTLPFADALDTIRDPNSYYVIVTRGHRDDRLCLETILRKPYVYCGMIGSKGKTKIVFDAIADQGVPREQLATVHAPIGLKIGANTPEEIAVCIVGELIQVKNSAIRGSEWDEHLCRAIQTLSEPYAMVTLIAKTGSAPRSTGARMIVTQGGSIVSSVGGGFGEYEAAQYALEMLRHGPKVKRYTCRMNYTDAASAGMVCGGEIDILIQITEANHG